MRALRIALALSVLASPVDADDARRERLVEILESLPSVADVDIQFAGCFMVRVMTAPTCYDSASWAEKRQATDLRIIKPAPPIIGREHYGMSQLVYEVRWPLSTILRNQNEIFSQMLEEGYAKHPSDDDARMRWFEKQQSVVSDPSAFSFSSETTRFCNGVTLTNPISTSELYIYVESQARDEFIELFAQELTAGCDVSILPVD